MAYKPTAEDFEDIDDQTGYVPSAEDFEEDEPLPIEVTKSVQPKESLGWKGLASDTIHSLAHALKGGIGFLRRAPGNVAEIGSELIHNPLTYPVHAAQQALAGVVGGARDIANIPHELVEELRRKKITPDWLQTGSIPEDTGLEKFLGLEPTKKSDELIRALPALVGGGIATKAVKKKLSAPDLHQSIRDTQKKVNEADIKSGEIFDKIEDAVEKRGINNIQVDNNLIDKAKHFLADTPENASLIDLAKRGDYKAIRSIQSDLRVKAEKDLAAKLSSENKRGEEISSIRNRINKSVETHFEDIGHKDLAQALNKVRNDYRKIKKTYFSTRQLARVFGEDQYVPRTPKTFLTTETAQMKRFMSEHPELKEALSKALKHEKGKEKLKSIGKFIGGVAGTGITAGSTYKYLGK